VRVLAFGTFDAALHPRVAVLIAGLRAHGHEVVLANQPLALSTEERVATLRQPWRLPRLGWELARSWSRLVTVARRGNRPDLVLVGFLGHFDVVLARMLFRGVPIVLDFLVSAEETARDRGTTSVVVLRALRWLDRVAIRSADVLVVDTDEHIALVAEERRKDVVLVPVGAPDEWFAVQSLAPRPAGPLRVVFFGMFTPLQGTPVIGRAISLLADDAIDFTVIGRGQDYDRTVREAAGSARVTWIPWVPPHDLPGEVAKHDVCLGIFGTGDKARSVVPNKVFQGMAAGLAIVTSDTAPQRRALDGVADLVPPGDPDALAEALRGLAADPVRLQESRARSAAHARSHMTAEAVTAALADRLGEGQIASDMG
jgi:glycosyltransferase involved in cell wall biosynthesis